MHSLKKAAERNHVSPGAVSQAIRKLEEELSTQLLMHGKNSLELTEQGKVFAKSIPEVLASVQKLKLKMADSIDPHRGNIYFGTQQSIASTFLPAILSEFKRTCPEAVVGFTLGHSSHMKDLLDRRDVEFAITMDNLDYKQHPKIPLHSGEFVFVSKQKKFKAENISFLLTGETEETKKLRSYYQAKYRTALPVNMTIDSWSVIKTMAFEGHGIGFIPDYLLTNQERRHICEHFDLPKITYRISCVYPENSALNMKSLKLLDIIKQKVI